MQLLCNCCGSIHHAAQRKRQRDSVATAAAVVMNRGGTSRSVVPLVCFPVAEGEDPKQPKKKSVQKEKNWTGKNKFGKEKKNESLC